MSMKNIGLVLLGLLVLILTNSVKADQCTVAFPAGLQSNASSKTIKFSSCGTQLLSNPSTILTTGSVSNPSGCSTKTCSSANCSASGSSVTAMSCGEFQTSSGAGGNVTVNTGATLTIGGTYNSITDYDSVTVQPSATLNFSTPTSGPATYRMNTLLVKNGSTVNLQPGDYWIANFLTSGGQTSTMTVQGTGTARVFIKNDFNTNGQKRNWNLSGNTSQLLFFGFGQIVFTDISQVKGILYGVGDISLGSSTITGAVTGPNVTLSSNSTITYDSTAVANLDCGFNCSVPSSVSQFSVSAPSTGTNCQNMTVTVTAQNSSGQTVSNYTGAITLTTQNSTGTWVSTSGGGSFSGGSSGTATYQFVAGDSGSATFQLSYPSNGASPVTIEAYQTNSSSINGYSNSISFIPASILVTGTAVSNPPASPPPAFSTTETAGNNFTLYLTAYNPSNCGIVTSYTGAKTIRFYSTYVNPTSGTLSMKINGTTIANSSGGTQTTQSITFTNGVATVTATYPDAGKMSLNVQDTSTGGPSGASGNFVVIPAQFAISIPNNTASQTTSPISSTVSACLSDAVFTKAGDAFTVNIQPQNSAGAVTPNFGNETSPEGILLTSGALLAPNPGRNGSANNGTIGNGSTFTKVTGSAGPFAAAPYFTGTTFSFDEVGCINLVASILSGNYLGSGSTISNSTVVGRFTPDHFTAAGNTPQFGTVNIGSGGTFTYVGQSFYYVTQPVLTVTACALAGTTTQNYTGSFWKLTSSGFNNVYNNAVYAVTSGDAIPAQTLTATIATPVFADGGNGTGTFTYSSGTGLSYQRTATLSPPYTAELQLKVTTITDSDNVACSGTGCTSGGFVFGATTSGNGISFSGTDTYYGKQFLYGRLAVMNASGPQNLNLIMPMQTQYYTSGGFVLNTYDSNTSFTGGASSLVLTPSTGLTTTATVPNPPTFSGGVLNITLSAPNTSGYVDVAANITGTGANLPWLQYAWPNTSGVPVGRGTFGVNSGNPRIIYQKETFH